MADVHRICYAVGGMPLGIELTANWLSTLTVAEIADQFSGNGGTSLNFLEADWRDVSSRQRGLRVVLDQSWALLTIREEAVCQALSVFRGGFTRDSALEVAGATLSELRTLIGKSFIQLMPTGRYEIHELTRQYAAEMLRKNPSVEEAVRDLHSSYFMAALRDWAVGLEGEDQQSALAGMKREIENVRVAWNWALDHHNAAGLDGAIVGLCRFYEWRVRYREGESVSRSAAATLSLLPGSKARELQAVALTWQGRFTLLLGQASEACGLLRRSLTLTESLDAGDPQVALTTAFVLLQLGDLAALTDRERAIELYESSLALYKYAGGEPGTANVLHALGLVAYQCSRYEDAGQRLQECLAIRLALGDRRGIADGLIWKGFSHVRRGSIEEGVRSVREGTEIRRELGGRAGTAMAMGKLGVALIWIGQYPESIDLLEQSIALCQDLGACYDLVYCRIFLGSAQLCTGEYEQAALSLREAREQARERGFHREIALAQLFLGAVATVTKEYAEGQEQLLASVAGFNALGQRDEMGWARALLALILLRVGDRAEAWASVRIALLIGAELGAFLACAYALLAAALLLSDQGDAELAYELYVLVQRYPMIGNAQWTLDSAGRSIKAAAAELSAEVQADAERRGLERELFSTGTELLAVWDAATPRHRRDQPQP